MTGPGDQLVQAMEADEMEQAEAERRATATLEEEGAVKDWLKRIEEAREFDKAAREATPRTAGTARSRPTPTCTTCACRSPAPMSGS
ncbi:hypothetical protein [Stenotrophomonas pictorum]|uniref:hypothetical protein n=1 Tax=Stenotrophomonas pictorum TaxID=86184 RepID=UPI0006CF5291|nr:hypothetical protein [Stenotrophomonas pictorum]